VDTKQIAIKTDGFEGPLELLIELVEKRKLLINDISLAAVTDEYMRAVSAMQELSLPGTAHFIALAATLLLIKSKSLLPVLDLSEEEEASIEDLEERLKRYQVYRDAAMELSNQFGKSVMFGSEYTPPRDPLFLPDVYCDIAVLETAMIGILTDLPKDVPRPTAKVKPAISLEVMIENVRRRVEQQLHYKFSDIRRAEPEHKNVIVGFLAVLELCKQGDLLVRQHSRFADIELEAARSHTPRYY
jgi:segregation and condensation protein A